jgi:hypothetical protein
LLRHLLTLFLIVVEEHVTEEELRLCVTTKKEEGIRKGTKIFAQDLTEEVSTELQLSSRQLEI